MIRNLRAFLGFSAVTVLVFWKVLFHPEFTLLSGGDMCSQTYPWFNVAAHWLKKGAIVLWDPYVYSGKANLGELQPGVLYPLNWLFMLIPSVDGGVNISGLQFLIILNYFLSAWFAYLLARSFSIGEWGAAAAALVFAFGGYASQISAWVNIYSGFIWLPLIMLFFRKSLLERDSSRWRFAALGSVAMALSFLAGHHAAAVHAVLLLLMYTGFMVLRTWNESRWSGRVAPFFLLAAVLTGFVLLIAVQLLPSAEWARFVWRWVGEGDPVRWGQSIPYSVLEKSGNVAPSDLVSLLIPFASTSANLYVGATVLLLFVTGLLFGRGTDTRFFAFAAFAYLFLSWGKFSALHGWANTFLPGLWFAREVYLYLIPFQLCLAMVAGWGLDALMSSFGGTPVSGLRTFLRRLGWGLAYFAAFSTTLIFAVHTLKGYPLDHVYLIGLAKLSVESAILGLLLFFAWTRRISIAVFASLILTLTFVNLATHTSVRARPASQSRGTDNPAVQNYWKVPPSAEFLRNLRQREVFRVDNPSQIYPPNFGDAWLIEETMGHGATGRVDYFDFRGSGWGPGSNASALLNARYFVSRDPVPGMTKVFEAEESVYMNPRAVPRAFAVSRGRSFPNNSEVLKWLATPLFAPGETVLFEESELAKVDKSWLTSFQDHLDGLHIDGISYRTAAEKQAEATSDQELRHKLNVFGAPWGWSAGDEISLLVRSDDTLPESYVVLNCYPAGRESRLVLKVEGPTGSREIAAAIPAATAAPAQLTELPVAIGALGPNATRISFIKGEECPARIDSLRLSRSMKAALSPGEVKITSIPPNSLRLQAELSRPAFVVVSDTWYPGWAAEIDGKRAPVLQADFILRAIPLPAGKHEVILRFRSPSFLLGLAISGLGCIALIVFFARTCNTLIKEKCGEN